MVSSAFARKAVRGSFIIVIAALVALPVVAAQGPGNGPCAEDMAKYCEDVQPGGGRILKCLREHENDLSPECKSRMESRKGRM